MSTDSPVSFYANPGNGLASSEEVVHTQEQYGLRTEAVDFPMMLVLSFVYPCNAKCPHCPYTNSAIRDKYKDQPYMSEEIFKQIVHEVAPYGAFLRISGGGEPMLHPQAVELLVYAKKQGCKIGLITNGSVFTEKTSTALLEVGIDMIEFSVDALDSETYAMVRTGLKWERLVRNVSRMLKIRDRLDSGSKIVASGVHQKVVNIDQVEQFWRQTIGVDQFIKRKFLTWGVNTSLTESGSGDTTPYLDTQTVPCPFIFERLNIDSRGNVMVCGYDITANTSMGLVGQQTIREIWHGPGFQYYREQHLARQGATIPLCASCPDWKYRSWQHNYWKIVKNAEQTRRAKRQKLHQDEDFQTEVID